MPTRDEAMGAVLRLSVAMEALAAAGAHLRALEERITVDERVGAVLSPLAEAALGGEVAPEDRVPLIGAIRTFFEQAADLLADPGRAPGWTSEDPVVLQSTGAGSVVVADVLREMAPRLGDLAARLAAPGGAFLDVGTGVGLIAASMATAFPTLRVVGIDRWEPSLSIARRNLASRGLAERVELRAADASDIREPAAYDLVWLPGPFLSADDLPRVTAAAVEALRPGGWLALGVYGGPPEPLARLVADLRAVRSGGSAVSEDELVDLLGGSGLTDVHEVARTWQAPIRMIVGRARFG